ncbi:hypothetical protein [Methanosarcina horonobensis]|uniref:hypothetical protein n=1 Tax=Methanosarcina horonobensis TaxID=418008 RepID=UPI0022B87ED6|nr:hypothetical protein [Methanosarcina horonobensis]
MKTYTFFLQTGQISMPLKLAKWQRLQSTIACSRDAHSSSAFFDFLFNEFFNPVFLKPFMIKRFKVSFACILYKLFYKLLFKISMVRLGFMYCRGFMPGRMAFMAVFACQGVLKLLVFLPVYFSESGISEIVSS